MIKAAAGGGAWYWLYGGMNRDPNRILVSGNLELTQVDLSFKTAGRMTELAVREAQAFFDQAFHQTGNRPVRSEWGRAIRI